MRSGRRRALAYLAIHLACVVLYFRPRLREDAAYYYEPVRSAFFEGDLNYYDERSFTRPNKPAWRGRFAAFQHDPQPPAVGGPSNPFDIGTSALMTPFFLAGHAAARAAPLLGTRPPLDGYSTPYLLALCLGVMTAAFCAILGLDAVLRRIYSPALAFWATVATGWGTLLPAYVYEDTLLSHGASFVAATLFLWLLLRAREDMEPVRLLALGASMGFVTIVRRQDVVVVIMLAALPWRRARTGSVLALAVGFVAAASPQMLVWRMHYGRFLANPLTPVSRWPSLALFLFSDHGGLFSHSPLLLLAAAGLLIIVWRQPLWGSCLCATVAAQALASCWRPDWWPGFGFGSRRMASALPFFAVGLAELLSRRGRRSGPLLRLLIILLVLWNMAALPQFYAHPDSLGHGQAYGSYAGTGGPRHARIRFPFPPPRLFVALLEEDALIVRRCSYLLAGERRAVAAGIASLVLAAPLMAVAGLLRPPPRFAKALGWSVPLLAPALLIGALLLAERPSREVWAWLDGDRLQRLRVARNEPFRGSREALTLDPGKTRTIDGPPVPVNAIEVLMSGAAEARLAVDLGDLTVVADPFGPSIGFPSQAAYRRIVLPRAVMPRRVTITAMGSRASLHGMALAMLDTRELAPRRVERLPIEREQGPVTLSGETRTAMTVPEPAFSFDVRTPEPAVLRAYVGAVPRPRKTPPRVAHSLERGDDAPAPPMALPRPRVRPQAPPQLVTGSYELSLESGIERAVVTIEPGSARFHPVAIALPAGHNRVRVRLTRRQGSEAVVLSQPELVRGDIDSRRSALLVSVDTLRADRIGAYGDPIAMTPHLDRLARGALLFASARTTAPWTLPGHVAMLASRFGAEIAAHQPGSSARSLVTLASHLRVQGYATLARTNQSLVSQHRGFDRGFDVFRYHQDTPARDSVAELLDVIDQSRGGATFSFLHLFDPHWDYRCQEPWCSYLDPGYRGPITGRMMDLEPFIEGKWCLEGVDLAHVEALYGSEVASVDHAVGLLARALARRGLWENMVLALVADHGEELEDHGLLGHNRTLYDELLHVPFILRDGRHAGLVADPVSLLDVPPTLASILGIPADPSWRGCDRTRLSPLDRPILAETRVFGHDLVMVVRRDEKTLVDFRAEPPQCRTFDLARDPEERFGTARDAADPLAIWLRHSFEPGAHRVGGEQVPPGWERTGVDPYEPSLLNAWERYGRGSVKDAPPSAIRGAELEALRGGVAVEVHVVPPPQTDLSSAEEKVLRDLGYLK